MKFDEALKEASENKAPEPDLCAWPAGATCSPVPFGLGIPGRLKICVACGRWEDKCECKTPEHSTHAFVIVPPRYLPQPECVNGKRVFGRRVPANDAHLGAVGE